MNTANLNHWGESFLNLAGPMLWQSSLLITIVFALDVLSTRKIRPAIRHALWMVVLVKLLLPPALALPTGAAWWLWPVKAAPLVPAIKHPTVTFDTTPLPENFSLPPFPQAPPPILSADARAMLASGVVSVGLLGWLVFQWPKAGRKNRSTGAVPEFENLLDDAQRLAGLRRRLQLRLIDDAQSPAVYGLWRPVILLPRALAEKLSEKQLRAVLLHEAIHVRRSDVWVNCAQTLLQIFYWWHPLLWLANARIRRLREEAVDDAVMLALRDEAEAYAPTLLEVAKFAFRRPLASLGLVGILESRSALRQRIERLVNFRPPSQAGVTLLSLCGIFVFSAVALPMGQAPGPTVDLIPANPPPAQASASSSKPVILIEGRFFWMQTDNFQTLTAGLPYDKTHHDQIKADATQLAEINQRINGLHAEPFAHPFIQTSSGTEADLNISDQTTSGIEFDCTPVITDRVVDLDFKVRTTAVPVSLHETDYLIVHEHAIVETNGGFIVYFTHPYNALSNLVLVIGVKTIEQDTATASTNAINQEIVTETFKLEKRVDKDKLDRLLREAGATTYLDMGNGIWLEQGTRSQITSVERIVRNLNGYSSDNASTNSITATAGRDAIYNKLKQIHLTVSYKDTPLSKVIRDLREKSLLVDPEKSGINFLFNPNNANNPSAVTSTAFAGGAPGSPAMVIDPATGLPVKAAPTPPAADVSQIKINLTLENATFTDLLNAVCVGADHQIEYSVEDYGIVFSEKASNTRQYEMRTFKVNAHVFYSTLEDKLGFTNTLSGSIDDGRGFDRNTASALEKYFQSLGVNWDPPKSIFYNDRMGMLFVYATPKDLDAIERAIQVLTYVPRQIHIKARFIEVPSTADVAQDLLSMDKGSGLGAGILTAPKMEALLHELESQKDTEELAEPEATLLSGRQVQMRATWMQQVVTNYAFQWPHGNHLPSVMPQIGDVEFGPVIDAVPVVMADGYTIGLKATAMHIQFFGYADAKGFKGFTTNYPAGKIQLPVVLPAMQVSSASRQALLYDGQTLVLFPRPEPVSYPPDEKSRQRVTEHIREAEKKEGKKTLVAFVTVTLIDPAGNRIHSDDDRSFAQNGIPPQPQVMPDMNMDFPAKGTTGSVWP
jgi:beta-lactamase regulating signal transducer with metallopeptidase domain